MSYTIKYVGTRAEKRAQALEDAKFYLGDSFDDVVEGLRRHIKGCRVNRHLVKVVCFSLSFRGVQGLPAWMILREALKNGD